MGVFGQLFGSKDTGGEKGKKEIPWIALTTIGQLEEIVKDSAEKTQFVYKHSTTCGISGMVLRMIEGSGETASETANYYFLDLHRYRDVSDAVAGKFGIRHESPQLLVIKKGEVVAAASHGAIAELQFSDYL